MSGSGADMATAPTVVVIIAQILAGATAATGRGSRANIATGETRGTNGRGELDFNVFVSNLTGLTDVDEFTTL